ncbi:hypothetical protein ILUMI_16423 [Ignelater luminosus]|uniref:Peptidase M14 domain-containing protein n=1 Tax=Ignelater luminosus TaxID=2038154 RepID=A0A8K0CUG0_IGNLU|nr:hypothetical protein ILUMI_16423 [Ignelater luminosus]
MYVGIHGYEGSIFYPWCYERNPCNDYKKLKQVAKIAVEAMQMKNKNTANYTIGNFGSLTCKKL